MQTYLGFPLCALGNEDVQKAKREVGCSPGLLAEHRWQSKKSPSSQRLLTGYKTRRQPPSNHSLLGAWMTHGHLPRFVLMAEDKARETASCLTAPWVARAVLFTQAMLSPLPPLPSIRSSNILGLLPSPPRRMTALRVCHPCAKEEAEPQKTQV